MKRRWSNRSLPKLKGRWGKKAGDRAAAAGFETLGAAVDSVLFAVVAGVVVAVLVFVFLPLLGIAFELVLLFLLLTSGIVGRVFLRRPWIIEATNLDNPDRSAAFPVKGWRASGEAIHELASAIPASGLPDNLRTSAT